MSIQRSDIDFTKIATDKMYEELIDEVKTKLPYFVDFSIETRIIVKFLLKKIVQVSLRMGL